MVVIQLMSLLESIQHRQTITGEYFGGADVSPARMSSHSTSCVQASPSAGGSNAPIPPSWTCPAVTRWSVETTGPHQSLLEMLRML